MMARGKIVVSLAALLLGCGGTAESSAVDAGRGDASVRDADLGDSSVAVDAALSHDAGSREDATSMADGESDAAVGPADDSLSDAGANATEPTDLDAHADLIRLSVPAERSLIQSPLVIRGEARGSWFWEAQFPVRLLDGSGNMIAQEPATARGEWMTSEFVPFEVTLSFSTPASENGTLVLVKDNPSGLPEHDDQVSVPVRFR